MIFPQCNFDQHSQYFTKSKSCMLPLTRFVYGEFQNNAFWQGRIHVFQIGRAKAGRVRLG